MTTRLVLACHTCEVIGPVLSAGATVTFRADTGRPRASAPHARADWLVFLLGQTTDRVPFYDPDDGTITMITSVTRGHAAHDLRLLPADYDPMIPVDGWMPRPLHGPGDYSGRRHLQVVACPNCRAVYHKGDPTRRAVSYQTADEGARWFYFCRECSYVWGEAARDRQARSDLLQTPLAEALWDLQRQGIQDQTAHPRLPIDTPANPG